MMYIPKMMDNMTLSFDGNIVKRNKEDGIIKKDKTLFTANIQCFVVQLGSNFAGLMIGNLLTMVMFVLYRIKL